MIHTGPTPLSRPTFRVLESNPYLLVRYDPALRLALITRRPVPYPDMNTLHWAFDRILASYASINRAEHRIIVDTRGAPPRNDEAFESAMSVLRPATLDGFARIVFFVRTVVGKLQIGRHAQSDGMTVFISADLAEIGSELGIRLDDAVMADPDAK